MLSVFMAAGTASSGLNVSAWLSTLDIMSPLKKQAVDFASSWSLPCLCAFRARTSLEMLGQARTERVLCQFLFC